MTKHRIRRGASAGFSLLELLFVLVITAVLASLAYPSFISQIRQGRRADARAALMNLLQQEERYMTQRNTYLAVEAGATGDPIPFRTFLGTDKASSSHLLGARACEAVENVTPALKDCVEVFALPTSHSPDPEVTEMAVDTQGRRRCTGSNVARCWQ